MYKIRISMARRKKLPRQRKARKNYFRLITDPRVIRKRTGVTTKKPKAICNQCELAVNKITHDRGDKISKRLNVTRFNHLGYWCDYDLHFFALLPVLQPDRDFCIDRSHKRYKITIDRGKEIADEANIERLDPIGEFCYECQRFDQTKTRRVIIRKKDKLGYWSDE